MKLLSHPFQETRESLGIDIETFASMLTIEPNQLQRIESGLAIASDSVINYALENELISGKLDQIRRDQALFATYSKKIAKFAEASPKDRKFIQEVKSLEELTNAE